MHVGTMKIIFIIHIIIVLCCTTAVELQAMDFKAKGVWEFAFSTGDNNLVRAIGGRKTNNNDTFHARQRVRLQMDAIASEALSGTVFFEIGNHIWGQASGGMALGADGTIIKLRQAYIDWVVPHTRLKLRMGIQNLSLPKKTGGGLVMDNLDTAAISASFRFSDMVTLTALWARPFNDNYLGQQLDGSNEGSVNYLDAMNLFALIMPLRFNGLDVTPWIMYGMRGKNSFTYDANGKLLTTWKDGMPQYTLSSNPFDGGHFVGDTDKAHGAMFWAGLPIGITAFDPWNIEFDFNYGYIEEMGRYDAVVRGRDVEKASTKRAGWIAMGLLEYKFDWGIPGVFGWYGSGDDGTLKNGSERMPSIDPWSKFTSHIGSANFYPTGYNDLGSNYQGTWGIGMRLKDLQCINDLKHTFRMAYWGGTNNTSMVKYAHARDDWNYGYPSKAGMYLTQQDSLLEFNFDSYYQMYANLLVGLELGYVVNNFDKEIWQKDGRDYLGASMSKQDAWRATFYFRYSF